MILTVTAAGFLTSIAWIPYLQGKCRIERENRSEMEAIMTEEKNRETAPVQLETARMILRDHRQGRFRKPSCAALRSGGDVLSSGYHDSQQRRIPEGSYDLCGSNYSTSAEGIFPAHGG